MSMEINGEPFSPQAERVPYAIVEAILETIAKNSVELPTAEAVSRAIFEAQREETKGYFEAIQRSRHSIFYDQIQHLYAFGLRHVPTKDAATLIRQCGRHFMRKAYPEFIHPILQIAFSQSGDFQQAMLKVLLIQIHHSGGAKYVFDAVCRKDEIHLTMSYGDPEPIGRYLSSHGLVPEDCLRNSVEFVGGVIEEFLPMNVQDCEVDRFDLQFDGRAGTIRIPIRATDHIAYESVMQTLLGYIENLKERQQRSSEDKSLEDSLIIRSALMRETWDRVRRAGRSNEIVLLRGESGTGKSFIARKIHEASRRIEMPFVEVCVTADLGSDNLILSDLFGHERGAFTGAIEKKSGLFSLAHEGTIFLDEIGDASAELQSKLLRVLETSTFKRVGGVRDITVDVRIIAATNCDLEKMVREGSFRKDLYYRINIIPIHLPPLRDRLEEVPELARFLFDKAKSRSGNASKMLAPSIFADLTRYSWPGNIRELEHALRHALAMSAGDEVTSRDLPLAVKAAVSEAPVNTSPADGGAGYGLEGAHTGCVINIDRLTETVRRTSPHEAALHPSSCEAHIEYAKYTWLKVLIDICQGDLPMISRYWDRSSEKTLRNLVHSYGLGDRLHAVRKKSRTRTSI
jgi:DNA-binding NtrC family response regulator